MCLLCLKIHLGSTLCHVTLTLGITDADDSVRKATTLIYEVRKYVKRQGIFCY